MDNKENKKTRKIVITLIIILIVIFIILFKFVSFGYSVKHINYSNDDKLINLGVPKFSFLMQNNENNYSFKSFRGKNVLEKEVKDYLKTLNSVSCKNTVYYYDESADITIVSYSVTSNILYNTISYSVRSGNYCNQFWANDYSKKIGGYSVKSMDTDSILVAFYPSVRINEKTVFTAELMVTDKKNDKTLEASGGRFEIKNDEFIYYRDDFYDKDDSIDIPDKSVFKIKEQKLILEDNYLSKYEDEVVLKWGLYEKDFVKSKEWFVCL